MQGSALEFPEMFVKVQIPRPFLIHTKVESQEVLTELENDSIKCGSSHCKA